MFQFPRSSFRPLWIHDRMYEVCSYGFPHSDINGLASICDSPLLFAAYHVLHRLLVPRHPPDALSNLTFVSVFLKTVFLSGKNVFSLLSLLNNLKISFLLLKIGVCSFHCASISIIRWHVLLRLNKYHF